MATLVLQAAGQALGGFLGGPVGAVAGRAIGAIAGSFIDQAILGPGTRHIEGPRLKELLLLSSSEGAAIPRLYGRARVSGQVIWATRFEEVVTTRTQKAGGKGSIGGPRTKTTTYSYFANFAVGLCEGEIARIGRVWADGKLLDISPFTWRLYTGTKDQSADSLILAKQGGQAPAYRGTAYIVFESLPLERFGNRIPQLSFEVFKPLDDVEADIRAVNIIPGATEFGYDTDPVTRYDGWGGTIAENTHMAAQTTDWSASMDHLQATCRNLTSAALVVAWFADDLRCANTAIKPGIETDDKITTPHNWSVAGLERSSARLISRVNDYPAFGSTPDDASVLRAIADLKARNISPVFYPFIMMDIAAGNTLADPYDPAAGNQPAYPWRGRITCDPAPGITGTPDKTSAVQSQIDAFFGIAAVSDFSISSGSVVYSGPDEWGLRRMVLHYAHLCALAGGVDAFLLASELAGLTILRDDQNRFPAVEALTSLASDVASILPDAKISYAADWSEYASYRPQDGSNDVWFHLDSFWSSPDVGFVAIDNYMPLADWRDGEDHADWQQAGHSIYNSAYLEGNIAGGEYFDWYYQTQADRDNQTRTAISDTAHAKHWVFRAKDIAGWWSNLHYNRPAGVEEATPTSWVAQSKPVWFTELGCPAVDKGPNQPNVFYDPKSSESSLPYFSSGARDDFIQRRYIAAHTSYWSTTGTHNPLSAVYGGPMVEASRLYFWAWDARPFPAFPYRDDIWADGANYQRGHWLNGRMGAAPLAALNAQILTDYGFTSFDVSSIEGVIDGYVIDRIMSARQALEPLALTFAYDGLETQGIISFRNRNEAAVLTIDEATLVEEKPDSPVYEFRRTQETELPNVLSLAFLEADSDYATAAVTARKLTGYSQRHDVREAPMVIDRQTAARRASIALQEVWSGRETARFSLPPSLIELDPGDVVEIKTGENSRLLRIEEIDDGASRGVTARLVNRQLYEGEAALERSGKTGTLTIFGAPRIVVLDLPLLSADDNPFAARLALAASPWPGSVSLLENTGGGYELINSYRTPAIIGKTVNPLPAGPLSRLDHAASLQVELTGGGELASVTMTEMLAGANRAAVGSDDTGWEIIQFANAELIAGNTYQLSLFLRGQFGSNGEMKQQLPAGSTFVLLDAAVGQISTQGSDLGRQRLLRAGPAQHDHGADSYVEFTHTPSGIGLRPLSPVQLKAETQSGKLVLSWIRRTRIDGDSWSLNEVPLGEDKEQYRVEILNGSTVVRTIDTSGQQADYSDADRQADFGLPLPATLTFRVAQISQTYGPGTFEETTVNV